MPKSRKYVEVPVPCVGPHFCLKVLFFFSSVLTSCFAKTGVANNPVQPPSYSITSNYYERFVKPAFQNVFSHFNKEHVGSRAITGKERGGVGGKRDLSWRVCLGMGS